MQAQSQSQSRHLRKDEVIQNQERKGQPNYLGQGHVAVISRLRWLHIFFSVQTGKEFVSNWIGVKHALFDVSTVDTDTSLYLNTMCICF